MPGARRSASRRWSAASPNSKRSSATSSPPGHQRHQLRHCRPPPIPSGRPSRSSRRSPSASPAGSRAIRPHLKQLLPPERVNVTHPLRAPAVRALPRRPAGRSRPRAIPQPTRFQTIELPPVVALVTEYQGHARTCPCCGQVTRAAIPRDILAHSVGPRLTATLSYFSGCHGVSKRGVEEIAAAVFDAPVALGTVANLEQEVSAALAAPHQEAVAAVRAAAVKHADETSWKLAGQAVLAVGGGHGRRGGVRHPRQAQRRRAWRRCWGRKSRASCAAIAGASTTACRRSVARSAGRT